LASDNHRDALADTHGKENAYGPSSCPRNAT
jgi:hypothetical protein